MLKPTDKVSARLMMERPTRSHRRKLYIRKLRGYRRNSSFFPVLDFVSLSFLAARTARADDPRDSFLHLIGVHCASVAVLKLRLLTASYHLLRGSNLLGCHFCRNSISILCRRISRIAGRCYGSEIKPHMRPHQVPPHAFPLGIHHTPQIDLRQFVSLRRRGCKRHTRHMSTAFRIFSLPNT